MNIGYVHHYGLGDNVLALHSLFLCKHIYNSKLIVFGNGLMDMLCRYIDFVDECVNIDNLKPEHIQLINSYNLDYIILTNPKRKFLNVLKQTNVKQIITGMKIATFFIPNCKTVPILLLPKYRKQEGMQSLFALVRKINPKVYDSKIKLLDLSQCRIQTSLEHKERITNFFSHYSNSHTITPPTSQSHIPHEDPFYLILLNPFSFSASHTLMLDDFMILIKKIQGLKNCKVLVVTAPWDYDKFMQNLAKHNITEQTLMIFKNNHDVLNLVEIISRVNCVISPSTGAIHVASNLRIPTIGIYSQYDSIRWATWDKHYVILTQPRTNITVMQREIAIKQVMDLLQNHIQTRHILPTNFKKLCLEV